MQPTLVLTALQPGLIYINGRFAGEVSAAEPLMRPVPAWGAVYLEYRPLTNAAHSLNRRLVFSGGAPLEESMDEAENLNAVVWPGGAVEIELAPPDAGPVSTAGFLAGSAELQLAGGAEPALMRDGVRLAALPAGAELPEYRRLQHGSALLGRCAEGMYLLTGDEAMREINGMLRALRFEIETDGRIAAVAARQDLVGHAALEIWRLTPEGLSLISTEPAWAFGAPRWPQTAEDTARAAVEAMLEGLDAEADGYLSSALAADFPRGELRQRCDLCVELKYSAVKRPAIGLLKLHGGSLARVEPLYYRATSAGGPQSPFRIDALEFAD